MLAKPKHREEVQAIVKNAALKKIKVSRSNFRSCSLHCSLIIDYHEVIGSTINDIAHVHK